MAGEPGVGQQPVHAVQPLLEDTGRIGRSLGFEQLVDVARRDALAGGDRAYAQLAVGQVGRNVRLDRMQPDGANTETVRTHGALARGVEGQGGQLVHVAGHQLVVTGCASSSARPTQRANNASAGVSRRITRITASSRVDRLGG
ncbi:MAG TPA: hypothetical protein VNN62_00715 [Methylomirabilota bacterium]|nr:hypothetical protein [Methylomirabilota bacterium]